MRIDEIFVRQVADRGERRYKKLPRMWGLLGIAIGHDDISLSLHRHYSGSRDQIYSIWRALFRRQFRRLGAIVKRNNVYVKLAITPDFVFYMFRRKKQAPV